MKWWARKSNNERKKRRFKTQIRTNARTPRNKTPYGRRDIRKENDQKKRAKAQNNFFCFVFTLRAAVWSVYCRKNAKKTTIICRALFSSVHWIFAWVLSNTPNRNHPVFVVVLVSGKNLTFFSVHSISRVQMFRIFPDSEWILAGRLVLKSVLPEVFSVCVCIFSQY